MNAFQNEAGNTIPGAMMADALAYRPRLFYLEYQDESIQRYMYNLVTSSEFDVVIGGVIITNVICMAIEHYDQGMGVTDTLAAFNWIFTIVFLIECICKVVAFGFSRYLFSEAEKVASGWNKFDFFLVLMSFVAAENCPSWSRLGHF
jgi:hypothetical protein